MSKPEALPNIQSLDPYSPGLSIAEIQDKYGLSQVIKLASNENPLGASPMAVEAVTRHAGEIFRYPRSGNPRLASALAKKHGVKPTTIAIGNGSDEIIDLLVRMLARPGLDNIVCFQPCFSIYPIQAAIHNVEIRRARLGEDFSQDMGALLELVDDNTRLVFITTPDNPSGYSPPLAEVRKLAEELARRFPRALLVIDEAYADFAEDENAVSLLAAGIIPDNAAFLRTMSKSWGLAGQRVGYAVLPEAICDSFWRSRLPFSVNVLAEEAALAALEDAAFRQATLKTVIEGRNFLATELKALGCLVFPSSANFLMFRLPENSLQARDCVVRLLKKGVIVRHLGSYGLPDHIRVSVGNSRENAAFIKALAEILQKNK